MNQGTLVRTSIVVAVVGAVALFFAIGVRRSPLPVLGTAAEQPPALAR